MLNPVEAREQLETFHQKDYLQTQLRRLERLPKKLREIGQGLLKTSPSWPPDESWQARHEAHWQAQKAFLTLNTPDRLLVFEALFPPLAPYAAAAWDLFDRLPYQVSWSRRAFRLPVPGRPEQATARLAWLDQILYATAGYPQDIAWFAAWGPYLPYQAPNAMGLLFAAALNCGEEPGQALFEILVASAQGEHPVGGMGRHVVRALLTADRPDGWAFIERLLLAAQREEGLRQVILEAVDESHPAAFRRMLHIILEHNLLRFSAATRALDVWMGFGLAAATPQQSHAILAELLEYLERPEHRERALQEATGQSVYLALWAAAYENALTVIGPIQALLQDERGERRFPAVYLLLQLGIAECIPLLLSCLADPDLRIAACALQGLNQYAKRELSKTDGFERLEALLPRLPHKENPFPSPLWDWLQIQISRYDVTGPLVDWLGERSPRRLICYLPDMDPNSRGRTASLLAELGSKDAEVRQVFFSLLSDPSHEVRYHAMAAIAELKLSENEIAQVEDLLSRKSEDLRRGLLALLLSLPDGQVLASAGRLLESRNAGQQLAGVGLLRACWETGRQPKASLELARAFAASHANLSPSLRQLLEFTQADQAQVYTLEDALGLMNPDERTRPEPPKSKRNWNPFKKEESLVSEASLACLLALDELVHQYRDELVQVATWQGPREELLGNVGQLFPSPQPGLPPQEDQQRLPLAGHWLRWYENRPASQRDSDGLETLRAIAPFFGAQAGYYARESDPSWLTETLVKFYRRPEIVGKLRYPGQVKNILLWLLKLRPAGGAPDLLLESIETVLSSVPKKEWIHSTTIPDSWNQARTIDPRLLGWLNLARMQRNLQPETWQGEHHIRLWRLLRWLDEPTPGAPRSPAALEDVLLAYRAGGAAEADILELLLANREGSVRQFNFRYLHELSGRKPHPLMQAFPILQTLLERCRQRILEVEVRRGDLPTAASGPARALRSVPGAASLMRVLTALGKDSFDRGWSYGDSRTAVLSHLVRASFSTPDDTGDEFSTLAEAYAISDKRLIELAIYAPQWAAFVETTLGWPRLAEAAWWIHAHTKDRQWYVDQEIRDEWAAQVNEYTPLTADSLIDGAVDAAWFLDIYAALGEDRWNALYQAAVYASGGGGHTRVRLFADALLGRVTVPELIQRIQQKRHQDAVRAIGLIPLPGGAARQPELLARYEVIQEFLRTSKKFGPQRQTSEKLAAAIGLENLARTAGYRDPQRLEWDLEVSAAADLAAGPVTVQSGEVCVTLSVDSLGEAQVSVLKNGKPLKSVPPPAKKDGQVAALLERKTHLAQQTSRMRASLEASMCRGDSFSGSELQRMFAHPVLKVMLEQLVFLGPHGMGYPVAGGTALQREDGAQLPVLAEMNLRIAHPVDFLESGAWHLWQRECFLAERIQPFKQIFRELYVLTETERADGTVSNRYAGQQVNPRQALALLGRRGWVTDPYGGAQRTFHDLKITASVNFLAGAFTPLEVEGLTIAEVYFSERGSWRPIRLESVSRRAFSEAMRDLDLVVSVAHAGGVDPEASASSIESRTALIHETCALLNIDNVCLKDRHALIEGKLSRYTVHLGSGTVHRQPGGSICIVPVPAQHRGRLFLPFVDSDPKTAEILSKILLLAKDYQIKDPTILEQILR